jgi:hypothetical protein
MIVTVFTRPDRRADGEVPVHTVEADYDFSGRKMPGEPREFAHQVVAQRSRVIDLEQIDHALSVP